MSFDEEPRDVHGADSSAIAPIASTPSMAATALLSALRLAFLQMARSPWLLAVVAVGVLAIDVLACVVPLYLQLIATTQLQTTIAQAPAPARNLQISASSDANNQTFHQQIAQQVAAQARQHLASFSTATPLTYTTSDKLKLIQAGSYTSALFGTVQQTQFDVFDYRAMLPHMHLIAGELPQSPSHPPAPAGQPTPIPVLITQEMATTFNVQVGQRLSIAYYSNNRTLHGKQTILSALVTGIWTPIDANDSFWNGFSFASTPYVIKYAHQAYPPALWPLLTTQDALYATLSRLPRMGVTQNWVYYTDPTRITSSNSAAITEHLTAFRTHLIGNLGGESDTSGPVGVVTTGRLDQLIASVQRQLNLLAMPLYMIAIQIVALAVLFVAAMARLLVMAQEQEIVTLKSRGASGSQLLGVFTAQSVPPGVFATASGPLLAVGLSLLLVHWFLPGSATDIASLTNLSRPLQIITPAIAGSVVGIGVVIASGFSVARLDVLAFRRELARSTHTPLWQRYYLDLGLVVLCLVGYLELSQFGTTQTRLQLNAANVQTQDMSNGASLLLLAAPTLLLLAGGLLLLRLVPLAARLGARLSQRGRGLPAVLALAQIARMPTRYARMILLLALAVGLGLFALVFDASLTQNVQDRTAYTTGADLRLQTSPTIDAQDVSAYSTRLRDLSGVEAVSGAYRTDGNLPVGGGLQAIDVLGVDPSTFAGVAETISWRSDYAAESLPSLMAQLQAHESGIQAGSQAHPMWAVVSRTLAQHLHLKVGDRFQGSISDIFFTPTSFVVGAIITEFPTLYPESASSGFLVLNVQDLDGAITAHSSDNNSVAGAAAGVNEFWLRTSGDLTSDRALIETLKRQQYNFSLTIIQSLREALAQAESNPVNGGMRGLLLLGALAAALLAVLGSVTQAMLAARQRTRQFAVLRTLGMGARQLVATLLSEQLVVYLFGVLGGTLLGLLLLTATVPYLQFSDTLSDPTTVGVPGYLLRINWTATGLFYGALLLAFLLALGLTARFAATLGLSRTLRIGED